MPGLKEYVNVPKVIGAIVSAKLASYTELQTTLSAEDAYDLLEILSVDSCNQQIARDYYESLPPDANHR